MLYSLVMANTKDANVPAFYHRESRQILMFGERNVSVDEIRKWAKGQRVPQRGSVAAASSSKVNVGSAVVVEEEEDNSIGQEELLDQQLTPLQRAGKQAIRDRTERRGE